MYSRKYNGDPIMKKEGIQLK